VMFPCCTQLNLFTDERHWVCSQHWPG